MHVNTVLILVTIYCTYVYKAGIFENNRFVFLFSQDTLLSRGVKVVIRILCLKVYKKQLREKQLQYIFSPECACFLHLVTGV